MPTAHYGLYHLSRLLESTCKSPCEEEADSSRKLNRSWPLRIENYHLPIQSSQLPSDDLSPWEQVPPNPPLPPLAVSPKLVTALPSLGYPKRDLRGTRQSRSLSLGKSPLRSQAKTQPNETPSNQSTTYSIYRPLSPIPNHPEVHFIHLYPTTQNAITNAPLRILDSRYSRLQPREERIQNSTPSYSCPYPTTQPRPDGSISIRTSGIIGYEPIRSSSDR
jgi:hypothetical protein